MGVSFACLWPAPYRRAASAPLAASAQLKRQHGVFIRVARGRVTRCGELRRTVPPA